MSRQDKNRTGKTRKVPATRKVEAAPVERASGAPLIVAVILIAAIALGLGYSLLRRNHQPSGIALPAATLMEPAPAGTGSTGSAAPADSARPQHYESYGATTLIN